MSLNIILRAAAPAAVTALALLLAACGGGGKETEAPAPAKPANKAETPAAAVQSPGEAGDPKFANAVASGKTTAGVDLKYDLASKPEPGRDFVVELALLPRHLADRLEVETTGIPGLVVVDGATAKFEKVVPGETYSVKVTVRAEQQGVYYLGVSAKMISQVQTEARTFSVPVVVGSPAAAEKTVPATDASGDPVEPMPAVESVAPPGQ